MRVEDISNLDALLFVLFLAAASLLVFRLVPRAGPRAEAETFSAAEIARYDGALTKYALTVAGALLVGSLHLAVKSLPPVARWLAQAGRGGHLAANIAYSHMVIVMGGTIAVTGLTWYVLPRVVQRPLYSGTLAQLAFWGTVLGAGGFYLINLFGGVTMGALVHGGMTDAEASDALGIWRTLPTAGAATLMGVGYWIFVINVLATCWLGRRVAGARPLAHLAGFFVLGTIGLLVGTVQGVLQVMPDNEEWLAAAGVAGRYIDPISHAHVNLLTGVMMLIGGLVFALADPPAQGSHGRRMAARVFWTLGPGSVALYLAFLVLGLTEGKLIVSEGLGFAQATERLGLWHSIPLAASAGVVLFGLWSLLGAIVMRFARGIGRRAGSGLICLGVAILIAGTMQGALQILPEVKNWMVEAGSAGVAVARTHAQVNMLGGVLTILTGLMLRIGRPILGADPAPEFDLRLARLMGAGVALYYLGALAGAIAAGQAIRSGAEPQPGLWAWFFASGVIAGAFLYARAAALLLGFVWRATPVQRAAGWRMVKAEMARHDGPRPRWLRQVPIAALLLPETIGAVTGFPGLGWILSGRALIGVPLIFAGPALAWAVLPLILSPYGPVARPDTLFIIIQGYLIVSATLSVLTLWACIRSERSLRPGQIA